MKSKNIIIITIFSLITLMILNIIIAKYYNNYIYHTLNNITTNLIEKNPNLEPSIIDGILKPQANQNILSKYGLTKNNLKELHLYQETQNKTFLIISSTLLIIIAIYFLIYLLSSYRIKKELRIINNYLQEILKGTYELNIADYNEDELSILKNDIYKVAIKLKESSIYERNEKTYLMHTLEDISHQLKTPLTALTVINDILKDNDLTKEEQKNFLNKSTKELEKMEWLITTLLKMSKIDSGAVKLKKENINAYKLITECLESLAIPIEIKEANITLNNLNFNLTCDINWTKEAFINILKNALEHLDIKGNIIISGQNNPLYKSITIKDNGQGIPKSEIKNIFKRFYSNNHTKNSVGIGLNMAKVIIENQKGKIEVESELGKYTQFIIIFSKKNV